MATRQLSRMPDHERCESFRKDSGHAYYRYYFYKGHREDDSLRIISPW